MSDLEANDKERGKALSAALSQIERQFGKGAMMRLGDTPQEKIPAISTGSLGLDVALGIGGLPRGRIVEIYGPESSGKTTLTLQVIAEAQKIGGTCAFIDAEHALDPLYAQNLGVDIENLLIIAIDLDHDGAPREASGAAWCGLCGWKCLRVLQRLSRDTPTDPLALVRWIQLQYIHCDASLGDDRKTHHFREDVTLAEIKAEANRKWLIDWNV